MNLTYTEHKDWTLPHWMDLQLDHKDDNLMAMMDVNQWCADQLGELGKLWGYERQQLTLPHPQGLNPVRIKLHYTKIQYSWRFKNKEDAMMFKLRWGGV
jgi:hypothetical protein